MATEEPDAPENSTLVSNVVCASPPRRWPTIAANRSFVYPIRPSLSRTTTPSLVVSTISRKRSSLARSVASAACRSRRSSNTAAPRTSAGNRLRNVQYHTASPAVTVSQPAV